MTRFLPFGTPPIHHYLSSSSPNKQPAWALVTGSSGGIGEALAHELACVYGFNVIIHGRNEGKLEKVREEILRKCKEVGKDKVEVKIIVADTVNAHVCRELCGIM